MKTFFLIFAAFFLIWAFFTCGSSDSTPDTSSSTGEDMTVIADKAASEGLDLELLLPLVREAKDAEDLERRLNEKDGINNLDLNADGKVDFIKVTEFGNKEAYGFSLTTQPEESQEQEIATIEIKREDDEKASVQVSGNQQIYGQNHYHTATFPSAGWFLLGYLLAPHPPYYSPFYWGYYPSYWSPWYPRPYASYSTYSRNYSSSFWTSGNHSTYGGLRRSYTPMNTGITSPNAGKAANSGIRQSLANPTQSQKSFQARAASKSVASGGFGRSSSSSTGSRSTGGRSSSRGFGGSGK